MLTVHVLCCWAGHAAQEKNSPDGLVGVARRFVKFGGGCSEAQLAWLDGQLQVRMHSALCSTACRRPRRHACMTRAPRAPLPLRCLRAPLLRKPGRQGSA